MKIIRRYIFIIALIGVALLHSTYLPNGFVWLDHGDIELGRTIIPINSWPIIFFTRLGQTGFYRPLVTFLNSMDYDVYGRIAMGYHLTNVLLQMGVVLATPFFLSVFFDLSYGEQIFAMFVVGVVPIQWLPVGAISYRQEIMYTLFTMLAIYWYAEKIRNGTSVNNTISTIKNYALFFLFTAYAFFSKETALIILPLLLVSYELFHFKKGRRYKLQISVLAGLTIIYITYVIFRRIAVPEIWRIQIQPLSMSQFVGTRLSTIGKLLVQLFLPFLPSFSDAISVVQIYDIKSILTFIFIVICILYIVRYRFSHEFSRFLILLGILLLPALNIVPLPRFYSPHYAYFAAVLIPMIFVWAKRHGEIFFFLPEKYTSQKKISALLLSIVLLVWIGIASYSTFTGGFRFKNDLRLFGPEVKRDDHFLEGHEYLGDYYFFRDDYKKASQEYERALKKNPKVIAFVDRSAVLNNLAGVRMEENRLVEADAILQSLQKFQGLRRSAGIVYNRALIAYKQKNYQKVVDLLYPDYKKWQRPEPLILLGESMKRLGREKESTQILDMVKKYR